MKFRSFQVLEIKGNSAHFQKEIREDDNPLYVIFALDEDGNAYQSESYSEYNLLDLMLNENKVTFYPMKDFEVK